MVSLPAIPAALKALKVKLNKVVCFIFASGLLLQKHICAASKSDDVFSPNAFPLCPSV